MLCLLVVSLVSAAIGAADVYLTLRARQAATASAPVEAAPTADGASTDLDDGATKQLVHKSAPMDIPSPTSTLDMTGNYDSDDESDANDDTEEDVEEDAACGHEIDEIADDALALVQDMVDLAYEAHLVADSATAEYLEDTTLQLEALKTSIDEQPELAATSLDLFADYILALDAVAPMHSTLAIELLELKLEALEARVAAAAVVNDWHALLQPIFALLTKTLDAGLDKDLLVELLDGLEALSGRVAEGPGNVASSLDCVRKTLEMLRHFEADLTTHDLITLHKVDLAIDALASDASDLCH